MNIKENENIAKTNSIDFLQPDKQKYIQRSEPMEVSIEDHEKFFDISANNPSIYFENDFVDNNNGTVTDCVSGLMWEKFITTKCSVSSEFEYGITYQDALNYANFLNVNTFAGFNDWRLPTVDEFLTLIEPQKRSDGLYLREIFIGAVLHCWSCDSVIEKKGYQWIVSFCADSAYYHQFRDWDPNVWVVRSLNTNG